MHLTERQSNEFFDAMDSLLSYVNRKFSVIPNFTMEINTALDEAKASLIARTLWDNRAIIKNYCEDNPDRLSPDLVNQVRLWEDAITDVFFVVRYHDDHALIMNDAGVFSLFGVTIDIDQVVGPAPAQIEATILPFAGSIIYDGFLQAFDLEDQSQIKAIQDDFEERVAKEGVIATAEQFIDVARRYNEKRLSDEMDALLDDIVRESESLASDEVLPAGFHRGALAAPGARERYEQTFEIEDFESLGKSERAHLVSNYRNTCVIMVKTMPDGDLASCIGTLLRSDIAHIGNALGKGELKASQTKQSLVDGVAPLLVESPDALKLSLKLSSPFVFDTALRLYYEGDFEFPYEETINNLGVQAMVPFTYVFYGEGRYRAVMPTEVRAMMDALDMEAVRYERSQMIAIARVASCAAFYYGVVPFSEVFRQYEQLYPDHVDEQTFRTLLDFELSNIEFDFARWSFQEMDYVIHYTLADDYVRRQIASEHFERFAQEGPSHADDNGEQVASGLEDMLRFATTGLQNELGNLQTVRESLIAAHRELSPRPLARDEVESDSMARLWEEPSVKALLAFLDAHVPDGQDDYDFADSVVEEILYAAIEIADFNAVMKYVESVGLKDCAANKDILPRLVTNVFNIVPSWDNYGWSAKELMEQITGRKIFLTPDGDIMKVGPDDPCPCGSGRKYRECHGR